MSEKTVTASTWADGGVREVPIRLTGEHWFDLHHPVVATNVRIERVEGWVALADLGHEVRVIPRLCTSDAEAFRLATEECPGGTITTARASLTIEWPEPPHAR